MRSEHEVGTAMQKLAIESPLLGSDRPAPFHSSVNKGDVEGAWRESPGGSSQPIVIQP
jgi:hypothetical protein